MTQNLEAQTLNEALYNTIHSHKPGIKILAEELDMAVSYLYRAALPGPEVNGDTATGCNYPLKKLLPLLKATRNYAVLDYIERSLGRVALPMPQPTHDNKALHSYMTKCVSEFGDIFKEFETIINDNKITPAKAQKFSKESYECLQAILAFSQAVGMAAAR